MYTHGIPKLNMHMTVSMFCDFVVRTLLEALAMRKLYLQVMFWTKPSLRVMNFTF